MYTYIAAVTPGLLSDIAEKINKHNEVDLTPSGQQRTKPEIDDVICHYLDGSTLKNALNFIDYVRASKMKIKWTAANVWSVRYKNKRVLDIIVESGSWGVRLVLDHMNKNHAFSRRDAERIATFVGGLRKYSPSIPATAPAMS